MMAEAATARSIGQASFDGLLADWSRRKCERSATKMSDIRLKGSRRIAGMDGLLAEGFWAIDKDAMLCNGQVDLLLADDCLMLAVGCWLLLVVRLCETSVSG